MRRSWCTGPSTRGKAPSSTWSTCSATTPGKASGQLMEFTYPAPADPTSASPEGHTVLRAEECFPYALHGLGGPRSWDGPLRHELVAARNAIMSQLVRDWDGSVLDYYDWTPLDNWRLNRSARLGQ